jgi:hypothetical protein
MVCIPVDVLILLQEQSPVRDQYIHRYLPIQGFCKNSYFYSCQHAIFYYDYPALQGNAPLQACLYMSQFSYQYH